MKNKFLLESIISKHRSPVLSASDETTHFTRIYSAPGERRSYPKTGRGSLRVQGQPTYKLLLNRVFAFAPISVCVEVMDALCALDSPSFLSYITASQMGYTDNFNEYVDVTLVENAPSCVLVRALQHLQTFDQECILSLFIEPATSFFALFLPSKASAFNPTITSTVFTYKNKTIITHFLDLLLKLEEKDCLAVLLKKNFDNQILSPIELVFQRTDDPSIVLVVIDKLGKKLFALEGVHKKFSIFLLIKQLIDGNNYRAFIKILSVSIDETNALDLTAIREYAQNNPVFQTILDAFYIYHLIITDSNYNYKTLQTYVCQHPAIVDIKWEFNKTLLHYAAQSNKEDLVRLLLDHNACIFAKDQHQKTPIDYVITHNNVEAWHAMNEFISASNNAEIMIEQMLSSLPPVDRTFGVAQKILSKTYSEKRWLNNITGHLNNKRAASLLYFVDIALFINRFSTPVLQECARNWLIKIIENLNNFPIEKSSETHKLAVLLFIFSLTPDNFSIILSPLSRNEHTKKTLRDLMLYGYQQTGFISSLSRQNHFFYIDFLFNFNDANLFRELATLHFLTNDLCFIPEETILFLSQYLKKENFKAITNKRKNGALLILYLEKIGLETGFTTVDDVFLRLEQELDLFNDSEICLRNEALYLMLNLAQHPVIKSFLENYYNKCAPNSFFKQRIESICLHFNRQQNVLPQSYLRSLLHTFTEQLITRDNYQSWAEIFSIYDVDELNNSSSHLLENIRSVHTPNSTLRIAIDEVSVAVMSGLADNKHAPLAIAYSWWLQAISANNNKTVYQSIRLYMKNRDTEPSIDDIESLNLHVLWIENLYPLLSNLQLLIVTQRCDLISIGACFQKYNAQILMQFLSFCTSINNFTFHNFLTPLLEKDAVYSANSVEKDEFLNNFTTSIDSILLHFQRIFSIKLILIAGYGQRPSLESFERIENFIVNNHRFFNEEALIEFLAVFYPILECDDRALPFKYLKILNILFQNQSEDISFQIIEYVPLDVIQKIVQLCLFGLGCDNFENHLTSKQLLTFICQNRRESSAAIVVLIRKMLGKQDFTLLQSTQLTELAIQILASKDEANLMECTYDGVWIQRLLISPLFISEVSSEIINALSERYRLISLTLKQDELEHYSQKLLRPNKHRLHQFKVGDCMRAIFIALQDNCSQLILDNNDSNRKIATQALHVLHRHFFEHLPVSDGNFFSSSCQKLRASPLFQNTGDLVLANNKLYQWMNRYLPQFNFIQQELHAIKPKKLYDETGKQIAFITENNCVVWIDGVHSNDFQQEWNHVFYNKQRAVIGSTDASNIFKPNSIFQNETAALLLAKIPQHELEAAHQELFLLVANVVQENSLGVLYNACDAQKLRWVKTLITGYFIRHSDRLNEQNGAFIINHHDSKSVYEILAALTNNKIALTFFINAVQNHETQQFLFSPHDNAYLKRIFKHHNRAVFLAELLLLKVTEELKVKIMVFFSQFSSPNDRLTDALFLIRDKVFKTKEVAEDHFNTILNEFLLSNACCQIIWNNYLLAHEVNDVCEIDPDKAKNLSRFFYKANIIACIRQINSKPLTNNYQYRVLLVLLHFAFNNFFVNQEIRFRSRFVWKTGELADLTLFIKRHFLQKINYDLSLNLGKKILTKLIFRNANAGNIDLFYGLYETLRINKAFLFAWLPAALLDKNKPLKIFDDKDKKVLELLSQNDGYVDWTKIKKSVYQKDKKFSVFLAFIQNYSGNPIHLQELINSYLVLLKADEHREPRRELSQFLVKHPHSDVSHLLFNNVLHFYDSNPRLLDKHVFANLSRYLTITHMDNYDSRLELIHYLGQHKMYNMVRKCCGLLVPHTANPQLINKIALEAYTEQNLEAFKEKWYFYVVKLWQRFWAYDSKYSKTRTNIVRFCEENGIEDPKRIPFIRNGLTPIKQVEWKSSLNENHQRLKNMLKTPAAVSFFGRSCFVGNEGLQTAKLVTCA